MSQAAQLTIDAESVTAIMSSPAQILIEDTLLPLVRSSDFGVEMTVFDRTGRLRRSPSSNRAETSVRIAAVPHDVLLIASTEAGEEAARTLLAAFEAADARPLPVRVFLESGMEDGDALRAELASRLIPIVSARLRETEKTLAAREAELVELRRLAEWQALGLRRGREIVEAIGFDTRVLACEFLPGAGSVRSADMSAPTVVQRLPVDLSGICAVALHLCQPVKGKGRIIVGVCRPDTRVAEAQVSVDYRSLSQGWNEFRFAEALGPVHGDALLTIGFMSAPDRPLPLLSLTDTDVAGFGLLSPAQPASLALRVWKGLSSETFGGTAPSRAAGRLERISATALRRSVSFLEGAAAEAVLRRTTGLGPLVGVDGDGRLRLRSLRSRPSGALLKKVLPVGAKAARITVLPVNTGEAISISAGLLVATEKLDREPDALRKTMTEMLKGVGAAGGSPSGTSVKLLSSEGPTTFELELMRLEGEADLIFFVGPTAQEGIEIVAERFELEVDLGSRPDRLPPFARQIPFPELKSRVGYVFGDGEAARASAFLGFSVLEVSDVENFMQTHPMLDQLTGARVRGVLPSGLVRVGAKVGTMHPLGPVTEYSLLIIRADAGEADPSGFADELAAFVADASAPRPDFVIGAARTATDPGQVVDFDLDLEKPLEMPADLLCVVRSPSGHINFAWCRWFGLRVQIATPKMPIHEASRPRIGRHLFRWR